MKNAALLKQFKVDALDLDSLLLVAANLAEDGNANALPQLAALIRIARDRSLSLAEQASRLG